MAQTPKTGQSEAIELLKKQDEKINAMMDLIKSQNADIIFLKTQKTENEVAIKQITELLTAIEKLVAEKKKPVKAAEEGTAPTATVTSDKSEKSESKKPAMSEAAFYKKKLEEDAAFKEEYNTKGAGGKPSLAELKKDKVKYDKFKAIFTAAAKGDATVVEEVKDV